jgi:hypothetical protein
MPTTTNYGWTTPADTDLVKDGAGAIRTLGTSVDTTVKALNPGTTSGDLDYYTAATTKARIAKGTAGQVFTMNSGATAPEWATPSTGAASLGYTAGKNKIINGDFGVWQRGTSAFTVDGSFTSDRWSFSQGSTTGAQVTQGVFTAGELSTGGSASNYYLNLAGTMSSASLGYIQVQQPIEDVRTFENTTAIVSFYAKGSASGTINIVLRQLFGTGGSAAVLTTPVSFNITTSWARYSTTVSIPSVSGKTIGAGSSLQVIFVKNMGSSYPTFGTSNYTGTLSLWGVQLEAGSTATAFQTATGTIQGELAACQRYYWNISGNNQYVGVGYNQSTTEMNVGIVNPVAMRTNPTLTVATGTDYYGFKRNGADDNFNSLSSTASFASVTGQMLFNSTEISGTAGQAGTVRTNNASAKIEFSAEL